MLQSTARVVPRFDTSPKITHPFSHAILHLASVDPDRQSPLTRTAVSSENDIDQISDLARSIGC